MVDFARLVMASDTTGLEKGRRELGRLTSAGAETERSTRKSTDRMGRSFSALGQSASVSVGTIVGRLVALSAATIGIGHVGRTIADFGSSMSQVQAITRATDAEMVNLRETAKGLGESTEFSAAQAADGLRFLGMAGFSAAEGMAAIPAVLDLATASGLGLAQSADIASNVLSGFGLEAADAGNVADILAAASSRANTNVTQLGAAMSTVAPIAASLGIDIETTAAAIGVMSDAGIQGERAGTAMRGVLASLAGPTKAATDALAAYGLTAEDVDPTTRELADIMATLGERGLTTADAMTIFGREAASGALVLVEGASRLREFTGELGRVDGEAQRMATTMRDNLGGDMKALGSALQGLVIGLGDAGLTGALRASVQGMTDLVRFVSGSMQPAFEALGVTLAFVAGTQLPALGLAAFNAVRALAAATTATTILTGAMRGLGVAVAFAGGPIGLVVGLLAAGGAAFLLWDRDAGIAETASYDAAAGTAALMGELDALALDAAPAAQAAVIDLANANIKLADSAFEAAKAELAKRRSLLDMRNASGANGSAGSIRSTGITETDNTVSEAMKAQEAAERGLEQAMEDRNVVSEQILMTQTVLRDSTDRTSKRTIDLTTTMTNLGGAGATVTEGMADATNSVDEFERSTDSAADTFASMVVGIIDGTSSIGDALKRLGGDMLQSGLSGLFKNLFSGGGGGLGDLFAGFFDGGGNIGAGKFGVVGERGPELVSGPARVTSRADTARMMQGQPARVEVVARVENGNIVQTIREVSGDVAVRTMRAGLQEYDRSQLPQSIARFQGDPKARM